MKQRLCSELKKWSILLMICVLYYVMVRFTGIGLPCMVNSVTDFFLPEGLLCPGCGISRMLISMSRLDFYAAYGYNKALFLTWPIFLAVFLHYEVKYIRTGTKQLTNVSKAVLLVLAVLLIAFGIVRNII